MLCSQVATSKITSAIVAEFRELFYKPYRIIYQVIGNYVYVHCILDGRRDMQDTLQQRVLR
jgi:toxin ParE1/3/4